MANSLTNQPDNAGGTLSGSGLLTTPQNYTTLSELIDPTKPDVQDLYVSTFGDQGITGFLELTGAKKNAGTSDESEWYEEGRLHKTFSGWLDVDGGTGSINALVGGNASAAAGYVQLRLNDVVLDTDGNRHIVIKVTAATGSAADIYDVVPMDASVATSDIGAAGSVKSFAIIGNVYAQGTDQPGEFFQTGLVKRTNPYIITKEMYEVNGSQATNIGWLNVNGDYRWYLKNEMDARKRFMNQREMMLLYAQKGAATLNEGTIPGSEGYFAAVEGRGITAQVSGGAQGSFASMSDVDQIILELDKEGAPAEYAMYVNRATSLDIDDMLANGIATQVTAGLAGQFGAFNNDADMAVKLGFKSFTRGGYTFHKHDWKLLNDPTLGGLAGTHKGAMIPMSQVADAKSGVKSPALQMNYKAAGSYSREMEHWVTGGGVLGHSNAANGKDTAIFNYRSECNLVTRAANQHVVLK
jgi:hypothetical protein